MLSLFVKICFVTVCYLSIRLQGIVPKHLIGLVVIVAHFIIAFSLISFLNNHACQRIASLLTADNNWIILTFLFPTTIH